VSFTAEQVDQLLRAINPKRVLKQDGHSHVSQQDVRAHLIRIFGFGGWDKTILELALLRDEWVDLPATENRPKRTVPAVTYRCTLRLIVRCPAKCCVKVSDDVGTGTSPNLPGYGDAHDFAAKNAVSYALKRCAVDLGDQFGLSLYNKGQTNALVMRTLVGQQTVHPGDAGVAEVDDGIAEQVSLGDVEGASPSEPESSPWSPVSGVGGPLRKALFADITRHGWLLGLDQMALAARFAETYGVLSAEGSIDQLRAFRDALRTEAEAGASA